MRHLWLINPNTGQATTERLQSWVSGLLPSDVQLTCLTARFGAPYIACEASHAVAGHALLDAWAHHRETTTTAPDGVVIGCFGDPGLFALREASGVPVTGLAEASFIQAGASGRFAIVTGGVRWPAMLHRLAASLGMASELVTVDIVEQDGATLLADRDLALDVLSKACQKAAQADVASVILGGAGLAGYASALQAHCPVPILDSVSAAIDLFLADQLPPPPTKVDGFHTDWRGMPEAMQRRKNP
jgi:Asp/Glu/hydantoin racemase